MDIEVFKSLSEMPGPSGFEDRIRDYILTQIENYVDGYKIDALGNLITWIGDGEPKLMLDAHMDEIGFIVKYITDKGFLKIANLGGIKPMIAIGSKVSVMGDKGDITGVVGSIPPHLAKAGLDKTGLKIEDLYIDIGAENKDEVLELGIHKGTPIVFKQEFEERGKYIYGKAFDDRIGCGILVSLIKEVKDIETGTLYAVFSVQEEVGCRGALTAAYNINPKIAIAIEGTIAADTPGVSPENTITSLGRGPAIRIMDGSMIANKKLFNIIKNIAEERKIPYQIQLSPYSGTDAGKIQLVRRGVAVTSLSVPSRYIHTPLSIAKKSDLENTIKLIRYSIPEILERFK